MNWSDERYVRLYTRDTADWIAWAWQARALFPLLLRKADRSGVVDLGRRGKGGVAALVGLPPDVAEAGVDELVADGCVSLSSDESGSWLQIRNYEEAQEALASPTKRQRDWRERKRTSVDAASTGHNATSTGRRTETGGDAARRAVTRGNGASTRVDAHHARGNGASTPRNVASTPVDATPSGVDAYPIRSVPDYSGSGSGGEQKLAADPEPEAAPDPAAAIQRVVAAVAPGSQRAPSQLRSPPPRQERAAYSQPGSVSSAPLMCSRCARRVSAVAEVGGERLCNACRTPEQLASPDELRAMAAALRGDP
jgi:hypothetical protein